MLEAVRKVLTALNEQGYEAYIVGGAVRDLLCYLEPHDYDITTSARPDEIQKVAEQYGWHTTALVGKQFGVVIIVVDGMSLETATFRGESYGQDSHRPEKVWYADTLREDVSRRDFTVNAMAMDASGAVYDYVGGRKDIKKRRLVTVGNPTQRFREDALRLFRVCRFTGQLDFLPVPELLRAMPEAFFRVGGLSLERVRNELDKLMVTPCAAKGLDILIRSGLGACSCRKKYNGEYTEVPILPEFAHLAETPQSPPFHIFDAWFHTLAAVAQVPPDLTLRYAAFFHDVAKGLPGIRGIHKGRYTDYGHDAKGAEITTSVLTRLEEPEALVRRVSWLVKTHMKFHYFANTGLGDPEKWLRKEALSGPFRRSAELAEAMEQAAAVAAADAKACSGAANTAGTISFGRFMSGLALQMPVTVRDLHYDRRIPDACGRRTGACLRVLLQRVQSNGIENDPDILAKAAEKWLLRQCEAHTIDE